MRLEFIDQSIHQLQLSLSRIEKCLNKLSGEEVWHRWNSQTVSIGHLLLHLCGNVTQYILSGLGNRPDHRKRDLEFTSQDQLPKGRLWEQISSTVDEAYRVMQSLGEKDLLETRKVQGFEYTGIGIIIHVVEHFSYHVGQISYGVKIMKDTDLGYYAGMNLNTKNE